MSCSGRPARSTMALPSPVLGVRAGAGEIGAAVAAGREDRHLRAEAMDRAVVEIERDHAAAAAVLVHDQVDGEIFDEELGRMPQRLAVHRVQHGVAGAVGGGAGALRGALAVMRGHAAERALIDLAVLAARERQAPMLELVDRGRRVAAQIFDGVLVAEPVGALDGVVHVPAPVVLAHVAERGRDAALRRDRVRAGREHLGDAGGPQAGFAAADDRAQAGAAGADHDHVVGVILDRIGAAVDGRAPPPFVLRWSPCSHSERQLEDRVDRRRAPTAMAEERVGHEQRRASQSRRARSPR